MYSTPMSVRILSYVASRVPQIVLSLDPKNLAEPLLLNKEERSQVKMLTPTHPYLAPPLVVPPLQQAKADFLRDNHRGCRSS